MQGHVHGEFFAEEKPRFAGLFWCRQRGSPANFLRHRLLEEAAGPDEPGVDERQGEEHRDVEPAQDDFAEEGGNEGRAECQQRRHGESDAPVGHAGGPQRFDLQQHNNSIQLRPL